MWQPCNPEAQDAAFSGTKLIETGFRRDVNRGERAVLGGI
jgi:hypothetical protein